MSKIKWTASRSQERLFEVGIPTIERLRQKRIWYPGATYHAMARGIRRMVIFQDDTDYQVFLLLLKKTMILAAKKNT